MKDALSENGNTAATKPASARQRPPGRHWLTQAATRFRLRLVLFIAFTVISALPVAMLVAGSLLGPRRRTAVKQMPYESGMDPIHDTRRRFDVRFHLVAIAFLLFDVELLFLYPWAVASKNAQGLARVAAETDPNFPLRSMVFGEVMVFLALLALGLAYAWRKGVFQWR